MGQAFFTLSLGVGSMAIFGSYIDRKRRIGGEAVTIIALDTIVALFAGLIIFPICFSFGVDPGQGPDLIFVSLPPAFATMQTGRFVGALFFTFMSLAAVTTVVAVLENLIAYFIDEHRFSRKKASLSVGIGVMLLSLPCVFGFNIWKQFQPLGKGSNILDLEDFVVSQNLLPLGALMMLLFVFSKNGMGWKNFMIEVNSGKGMSFSEKWYWYLRFILPVLLLVVFLVGYVQKFA